MTHEFRRPHPPERHRTLMGHATRSREHIARCVLEAIGIALRTPLDIPGVGRVVAHEYHVRTTTYSHEHSPAAAAMAALATGDRPPPLPVALSLAPAGAGVVWIHTRAQWRRVRDAWRHQMIAIHSRAVLAIRDGHDTLDLIAGITPIRDDDGQVLPGLPATEGLVAREALWTRFEREYFNDLAGLAYRIGGWAHPAASTLAAAIPTAVAQLLERLDDAADDQRRWLLDDPDDVAHGPSGAAQEAALRLLERRRQAGRRAIRAATTTASAASVAASQITLVRGALASDVPLWQVGAVANAHAATLNYARPASGRWSQTVRVHNPTRPEHGLTVADLGSIVLDEPAPPTGWTVTSTPRAAPHADERDVVIAWNGTGEPEAGTVRVDLTARNVVGPSRLAVTINVPAPTTSSEG